MLGNKVISKTLGDTLEEKLFVTNNGVKLKFNLLSTHEMFAQLQSQLCKATKLLGVTLVNILCGCYTQR